MFSNQTPNYGLPQYEQNDTLNVLSDLNGAMETIDSTMKTNELAAASAQSKADGADTKANNNAAAITDLQTAQGADRTDINTLTGAINTINSLIGNGEPTTEDKTLIGAINELDGKVSQIEDADGTYTIKSFNTRAALSGISGASTFADLSTAILDKIHELTENMAANERLVIEMLLVTGAGSLKAAEVYHYLPGVARPNGITFERNACGSTQMVLYAWQASETAPRWQWARITLTDGALTAGNWEASETLTSHGISAASLQYSIYQQI